MVLAIAGLFSEGVPAAAGRGTPRGGARGMVVPAGRYLGVYEGVPVAAPRGTPRGGWGVGGGARVTGDAPPVSVALKSPA